MIMIKGEFILLGFRWHAWFEVGEIHKILWEILTNKVATKGKDACSSILIGQYFWCCDITFFLIIVEFFSAKTSR